MNWKYYIPHLWESDVTVWEDVYLLPEQSGYEGKAIWLTVDALGFFEEEERIEAERKLGDKEYVIEQADMVVATEAFSKAELLKWVRIWLEDNDFPVTELNEAHHEEFIGTGRVPELDALQDVVSKIEQDEVEMVTVDPETFLEVSPDTPTGHQYKLAMPRGLLEQLNAMPEDEGQELMQAIGSLADNPAPPTAKRVQGAGGQGAGIREIKGRGGASFRG